VRLILLLSPFDLDEGRIGEEKRVDLTDFLFAHGVLRDMSRAVKWNEECDDSNVDLTRHYSKNTLAKNAPLSHGYHTWERPSRWIVSMK
jgi:hypothetical protein